MKDKEEEILIPPLPLDFLKIEDKKKMRIQVGDIKEKTGSIDEKTGKRRKSPVFYSYQDVEYDIDGWADASRFLPEDFDLVYMRLKRDKSIPGWFNGSSWTGLRLKSDDKVVFWKRKLEEKKDL